MPSYNRSIYFTFSLEDNSQQLSQQWSGSVPLPFESWPPLNQFGPPGSFSQSSHSVHPRGSFLATGNSLTQQLVSPHYQGCYNNTFPSVSSGPALSYPSPSCQTPHASIHTTLRTSIGPNDFRAGLTMMDELEQYELETHHLIRQAAPWFALLYENRGHKWGLRHVTFLATEFELCPPAGMLCIFCHGRVERYLVPCWSDMSAEWKPDWWEAVQLEDYPNPDMTACQRCHDTVRLQMAHYITNKICVQRPSLLSYAGLRFIRTPVTASDRTSPIPTVYSSAYPGGVYLDKDYMPWSFA